MRSLALAPRRTPAAIAVIALFSVLLGVSSALTAGPASASAPDAAVAAASADCAILAQGAMCTFELDGGTAQQVTIADGVEHVTVVVAGGAGGVTKTRVGGTTTVAELREIDASRILTMELGAKGATGHASKVSWNDPSMARPLVVAGGGLGGPSGVDYPRVSLHQSVLGEIDVNGYVTVIAGEVFPYECIDSFAPRTIEVPDDVDGYYILAAGGSGSRGHNQADSEGRGAAVSGVIDVRDVASLEYWVGCSAYHGGRGYGVPGKGAISDDDTDDNAGDGGGATLVGLPGSSGVAPLMVAGGGGGSGGGAECVVPNVERDCQPAGIGGNGGGVKGTQFDLHGGYGNDTPDSHGDVGGVGGCGACSDPVTGDHDGSNDYVDNGSGTGPGGGGGSGYPRFGHGGGTSWADAGGGGGAGGSYTAPNLVEDGRIATTAAAENGFLLLVPMKEATTSLTVSKAVTGDAAAGQGGAVFTMRVVCSLDGRTPFDETFSIAAGIPIVLDGVPHHSECAVTETDAAGASTPAPAQTVQVGEGPASVTMTNVFTGGAFDVTVHSHGHDADGDVVEGVSFDAGTFRVGVSCHVDGRFVQLPNGAGLLSFPAQGTFAEDGATKSVTGVPIGAVCEVSQLASGSATTTFEVNGNAQPGDAASVTVTADAQHVGVTNAFPFARVAVAKTVAGDGIAPGGYSYAFSASCTYRGKPVTVPTGGAYTQVRAGGSASFPSLVPVGSVCGVTETDRGGATSVQYPNGSTQTIPAGGSTIAAVNTFSTDPLTVTLSASGSGAAWANTAGEVEVQIACTLAGVPQDLLPVMIPATGGTQSVTVADSSECIVRSVGGAGQVATRYASSIDPTWADAPVPVTATPDGADLAVDLVFDAASITVSSTNSGDAAQFANTATAATISECTFNGQAIPIGGADAVTIPFGVNGGSGEAPMVVGAECHVAQTASGGATRVSYATAAGAVDHTGATIIVGTDSTVAIDNVFDLGALAVTQTIAGDAAWAANVDTTVEVACTFNDLPLRQLGVGGIARLSFDPTGMSIPSGAADALASLPQGAICTATETEAGGATTVAYVPDASAVVAPGAVIGITNTFDAATYSVGVGASGNDATSHADDVFAFTQYCTFNGDRIVAPQTDPEWTAHLELGLGGSAEFTGLPAGAECVISENGASHATSILPSLEQAFTLPATSPGPALLAAGRVDIVFTMVFDATHVTMTQSVDGPGAATYAADAVFSDRLVCWYPGDGAGVLLADSGVADLSEASGWSATFVVPVGADCDVDQVGSAMATTVSLPDTIAVGTDPTELSVANSYLLGQFTVVATASGTAADEARFGFDATCVWPGSGVALPLNADATPSFALATGDSRQFEALAGASCSVAETAQNEVLEVVVTASGTSASTSGAVATAQADVDVPAAFEFRNYLAGSLPPTGLAIGGSLIAAILLFGSGSGLLIAHALRRRAILSAAEGDVTKLHE